MRRLLGLTGVLIASASFMTVTPVAAKSSWDVMLIGRVTDACSGQAIGGASVSVAPADTSALPPGPPLRTNGGGHFQFKLPSADSVLVSVTADGYFPIGSGMTTGGDIQFVSPPILVTFPPGPQTINMDIAMSPVHPPSPCLPPGPPN